MTKKIDCNVQKNLYRYEIEIGFGISMHQMEYLSSLSKKCAIITDDCVAGLYGESLCKLINQSGLQAFLFSFPRGEVNKTRHSKEILENQMFEKGLGRDSSIIALGGGVVTDLAGFIAATYCRGLPLVMIPTSLLGMVDASIGGKNGVNVPFGKNMVGTIYQPQKVVIDIAMLRSLPQKEMVNGIVEMIKHGLIADKALFDYIESNIEDMLKLNAEVFEEVIYRNCLIKKKIVEEDEKELGKRHLLNFGHTIGHALELLSGYSMSHGEAVAIGLIVESYISQQLGLLDKQSFLRIENIFKAYNLPIKLPFKFSLQSMLSALALDKKSLDNRPRFIMIEGIGVPFLNHSQYCAHVPDSELINALQWMNDDLCRH